MDEDETLAELSSEDFIDYLERVAGDMEASGLTATAEDYREAARRLAEKEKNHAK